MMLSPDPKLEQAAREYIDMAAREIIRLSAEVHKLRGERNDVRRLVCSFVASERSMIAGKVIGAQDVAKEMEWDCFKEDGK